MTRDDIDEEVADALSSPRLNDWERNFLDNIARKPPHYVLTPAQADSWRKIMEKVYAAG